MIFADEPTGNLDSRNGVNGQIVERVGFLEKSQDIVIAHG